MIKSHQLFIILLSIAFFSCKGSKVLNSWKSDESVLSDFEKDDVLVIARTSDYNARIVLEKELTSSLKTHGVNAFESFNEFSILNTDRELTDAERIQLENHIKEVGYNGVIITTIKDVQKESTVTQEQVYIGDSYLDYYPPHYGDLYQYYYYPYWNNPHYWNSPRYIETNRDLMTTSTIRTSVTYILETVAYDLATADQEKLVFVITSSIKDPKNVQKEVDSYVNLLMKELKLP